MSGDWMAVCETDECGWQGEPADTHFAAVCDIADHRVQTGTHDGTVYPTEEVNSDVE